MVFWAAALYWRARPANVEALGLRPNLSRPFPQLKDVKNDYAWTGNFLLTLSRLLRSGRIAAISTLLPGVAQADTALPIRIWWQNTALEAIRGQAERFDGFANFCRIYPFPAGACPAHSLHRHGRFVIPASETKLGW